MRRYLTILLPIFLLISSKKGLKPILETRTQVQIDAFQDSLIDVLFQSDVLASHGIFSTEWQDEIDKTLAIDSTIARLWQQKSMPLYKQGKYQLGRPFLDKAVGYKPEEHLDYRAFMICIFEKNYVEAIKEFKECMARYGDSYVMDHSYSFYIALSKIQLNQFEEAETLLLNEINRQKKDFGESNVHFLDLLYLGIARMEQNKFAEAIESYDDALTIYPLFADAQYYKALCLGMLNDSEEQNKLYKLAIENGKSGHTINEDNTAYERYPYQIRWNNH